MEHESGVERLAGALRTPKTFMTLANHCITALGSLGKTVEFIPLSPAATHQGFVYCQWKSHYKASISLQSEEAGYQSLAFALLIVEEDCSGLLVNSLNDERIEQLFHEKKAEIKKLVEIMKQLPLTKD